MEQKDGDENKITQGEQFRIWLRGVGIGLKVVVTFLLALIKTVTIILLDLIIIAGISIFRHGKKLACLFRHGKPFVFRPTSGLLVAMFVILIARLGVIVFPLLKTCLSVIYQFILLKEKDFNIILDFLLFVVVLLVILRFVKQIFCTFPCYITKCWCGIENKISLFSKLIIQILVFLCAVFMLYQILWQFQSQTQILKSQENIAKRQSTTEHFNNAIDHLGKEQQPVVLGGVHALHRAIVNSCV